MLIDKALDTEKRAARIIADACGSKTVRPEHVDAADKIIGLVGEAEWEPIATAPKEGHIIGYWEIYKRPCVMWWNVADQAFESWADRREEPSHWMPLPARPRATPHPTRLSERAE